MKKRLFVLLVCFSALTLIFASGCVHTNPNEGNKLIRIHIRANSNSEQDQNVKLQVRDALNRVIEQKVDSFDTFEVAYRKLSSALGTLKRTADEVLAANGFSYESSVQLNNEYFPTRTYEGVVVESGYYDALIVRLGDGVGDNWWCVVYPPLCYVKAESESVEYKSLIVEMWKKFVSCFD